MFHHFFISIIIYMLFMYMFLFTMFTAEKTICNVIVFYNEANKENAQYLVENMEHRDNYTATKYHIDFDEGKHLFLYLHT